MNYSRLFLSLLNSGSNTDCSLSIPQSASFVVRINVYTFIHLSPAAQNSRSLSAFTLSYCSRIIDSKKSYFLVVFWLMVPAYACAYYCCIFNNVVINNVEEYSVPSDLLWSPNCTVSSVLLCRLILHNTLVCAICAISLSLSLAAAALLFSQNVSVLCVCVVVQVVHMKNQHFTQQTLSIQVKHRCVSFLFHSMLVNSYSVFLSICLSLSL